MRHPARLSATLLLLAGCAAGPVNTERQIDSSPTVVLARIGAELGSLGFTPGADGAPGALVAATDGADTAWARCSPVRVSDGDDRRLMAAAERRYAEVRVTATPAAGRTVASVSAEFRASYRNRLRAASFERACRSTGVLEARLLAAGGG